MSKATVNEISEALAGVIHTAIFCGLFALWVGGHEHGYWHAFALAWWALIALRINAGLGMKQTQTQN